MRYSNAGEVLSGTRQFAVPGVFNDQTVLGESLDKDRAGTNNRDLNGMSKMFVITIDPQKLYTLGVSRFSLTEVTLGIRAGAFSEGTEFMSPSGRVRIMGGKLRYTSNKAIYKLPDIRV